jgi:hypothetical protein
MKKRQGAKKKVASVRAASAGSLKAVVAMYLIPERYERVDDENGYAVIVKEGTGTVDAPDDFPDLSL